MSAIPIIRGGQQGLFPATLTIHHDTFVQENSDGSEQRWIRNFPLVKLDLAWGALTRAEKDVLKTDFSTAKGRFTTNRSITFNGVTYNNMACESDVFEAVESETINYDHKLSFSQVLSQSLSPGTAGQPFPTFRVAISQLPWTQRKRYFTTVNKLASSPEFTWAWFGSGLTNFPTDGLMGWQQGNPSLLDAELSDLTAHFIANWGRFNDFSYTDEPFTAISGAINSSVGAVPFAADPGLVAGQFFQIDSEQFVVTVPYGGPGIVGVTRGQNGTTAASHASGAAVSVVYMKTHYTSDDLVIVFQEPNRSSVSVGLEVTF